MPNPDIEFILSNADRLITVTFRCAASFGLGEGLTDLLLAQPSDKRDDWHEAVTVLQRDTQLMAALRAAILLDRDETMVSFQTIYHRLKAPSVEAGLLQALQNRYGPDDMPPTRAELIEVFR